MSIVQQTINEIQRKKVCIYMYYKYFSKIHQNILYTMQIYKIWNVGEV